MFNLTYSLQAQIQAPGMKCYNSYWNDEDFCNNEITQSESGEDWFFDVSKSYNNQNQLNGFICCGYESKQCNPNSPSPCEQICDFDASYYCELRDMNANVDVGHHKKGTIWFVDARGHHQWYVSTGSGYEVNELRKVIQTYDGNYVAVGNIHHAANIPNYTYTPHIQYNPTKATNEYMNVGDNQMGYVVKIDATTHQVIWQYTYGANYTSKTGIGTHFFNIIEEPISHKLYIAGRDVDISNNITKGSIFQLESNGNLNWYELIQHSSWSNTLTEFNGLAMNANGVITAGGACAKNGVNNRGQGTYGFLANFTPTNTGINGLTTQILGNIINNDPAPNNAPYINFVFSLTYLNNGELVAPCIEQCAGCEYYAGRPKTVNMYRYNTSGIGNANLINTHTLTMNGVGGVEAYDMQCGIDKTADGGFVFLSTKRTATPPEPFVTMSDNATKQMGNPWKYNNLTSTNTPADCPSWYWNTSAYVAKYSAANNLEWVNTYPFTKYDPNVTNRGDITKHECLYKIVQIDDGSFVGCGNNSANFDDHILFNLHNDCQNRNYTIYDIGANATPTNYIHTLTGTTTWNSNKKIRGTIVVSSGAYLIINNGANIEFADSRQTDIPTALIIEPGGKVIVNNATLTSLSNCPNSVWDGIRVHGDPTKNQAPFTNQGCLSLTKATVKNARIGVKLAANNNQHSGGIVQALNSTFLNNWKCVEFIKYNSPSGYANVSYFHKTDFVYDGNFPDPDIFYNGEGLYNGYGDFVSMWDVQGVNYLGCRFENTTLDATKQRGRAIYSINATYKVDNFYDCNSLPCNNIVHSSFVNVREGIKALMFAPVNGPTLRVHDADFINVRQGIGISGFTLPTPIIAANRINLVTGGNLIKDADDAWGIHSTACANYFIEENTITSDFVPSILVQRSVTGIAINNRHVDNTIVYKNTISNTRNAILPFGENGATGSDIGLMLKCNTLEDNVENDINTIDDGVMPGMIKDNQGGCINGGDIYNSPAGNTFTDINPNPNIVHLNTDVQTSGYNYHYRAAIPTEIPLVFTPIVTPIQCNITYDNLCPTHETENGGDIAFDPNNYNEAFKKIAELHYFNQLLDSNNVTSMIAYLINKSGKDKQDSLYLAYGYAAQKSYNTAISILNNYTDSNAKYCKNILTQLISDSLQYGLQTSFTATSQNDIKDSTQLYSVWADNIYELVKNQSIDFRIPKENFSSNKTQQVVTQKLIESKVSNIVVYPNPSDGKFTVLLDEQTYQKGKEIVISDITGRKVYSLTLEKNKFNYVFYIETSKGIYLAQVLDSYNKVIDTKKITIK
jgi:hypothetical protein